MNRGGKKVAFQALVLEVRSKSLRSGDKSVRVTIEIDNPSDELMASLNTLHRADRYVAVAIAEMKER